MRGFFGGLIIGLMTIAIVVVALSLLSSGSPRPPVTAGAPQPATGADTESAETGVTASGGDSDLVEMAPTAPGAQEGGQDDLDSLTGADTRPADKPSVGGATADLTDPGGAPQAAGVEVESDAPVAPLAPSQAPGTPESDTQPTAFSDPAQPAVPGVSQTGTGFGSEAEESDSAPRIATTPDPAPASSGTGTVATAPDAEQAPDPSTGTAAAPSTVSDPADTEPKADPADQATTSERAEPSSPQTAALPQTGTGSDAGASPQIGTPVVPLTERGKSSEQADPAAEPAAQSTQAADGPPIDRNAEAFENPEGRPLMSIVLIDDAAASGIEALAEFPYPLTFAIDPSAPDAAQKMARHRAAGFEVVALIDLPRTATAQDAEVSLSIWLEAVPQAVAVLEGTQEGIQGNRALSDQVTEIVADGGLGLIMQAKGLNTAMKLAVRDGVPAALVFRNFDGAGQAPDVMRRFLDQAAFRSGQQGGVIMLGHLRPDTISALLLWGLQDRASRVTLAPVSAVLKQGLPE